MGLIERLQFILENDFERLTYTEAINILRNLPNKKKKFQYLIEGFGADLQSEHERYLVEKVQKARHSYRLPQRYKSILYAYE